jgi:hypothetical protein
LTPDQQVSAIDATRGRLIQFGAGLLAFGAFVYTALNFRLSREGHVTDRYTKAIEQLGSGHLDVRLGAIYALERIMIDSARDHPTIVDVLAAFVREHSPPGTISPLRNVPARADSIEPPPSAGPATDVRAAMQVLGRRPRRREERGRLNLRFADLKSIDLAGAYLAGADLSRADLSRADLSRADLAGARLARTNLDDVDLNHANLVGAYMITAILTDADLTLANLTGADLGGADLRGANLEGATMAEAELDGADLTGANLEGALPVGLIDKQARFNCDGTSGTSSTSY